MLKPGLFKILTLFQYYVSIHVSNTYNNTYNTFNTYTFWITQGT